MRVPANNAPWEAAGGGSRSWVPTMGDLDGVVNPWLETKLTRPQVFGKQNQQMQVSVSLSKHPKQCQKMKCNQGPRNFQPSLLLLEQQTKAMQQWGHDKSLGRHCQRLSPFYKQIQLKLSTDHTWVKQWSLHVLSWWSSTFSLYLFLPPSTRHQIIPVLSRTWTLGIPALEIRLFLLCQWLFCMPISAAILSFHT